MILWWTVAVALGCGGMFGPYDTEVFSDAQQVIFEQEADRVVVEYLVDYGGDQTEFGWIVPIPGTFVSIEETDTTRFDSLAELTRPRPEWHSETGRSGGCGPVAKSGGGDLGTGTENGVTVLEKGTAGIFEYVVVRGDSVVDITTWLEELDFWVGDSFPSIEDYVEDEYFQFLAIQLAQTEPAERWGLGGRTAIEVVYEGNRMHFPARMSQYSMAPEQATTIYVLGDQRATMSGWEVTDFPEGDRVGGWSFEQDLRTAVNGRAVYAVTYADDNDGQWVTRFDTLAPSDVHDADAKLLLDGGIVSYHPDIQVYASREALESSKGEGGCSTAPAPALVGLWLGAAMAVRRRR